MTRVKVCGVTRPEDARGCAERGVDYLGLNFWPGSRRHIAPERAREVAAAARAVAAKIRIVGLFVNQERAEIDAIDEQVGLDLIQLHGDEPPAAVARFGARAIKALALVGPADVERIAAYPCSMILVDAPSAGYGGSGRTADWQLARAAVELGQRDIFLAGGLGPDNVAAAIAAVGPFAVDVASGVESEPGIKDLDLVARFVEEVRK